MANGNGDAIKGWMPVIVVLCGLAVTWGSLQTQVSANEDAIKEIEAEDKVDDADNEKDKIKIEVLATKQSAILDDVGEIKEEQKEQGKKLDKILEKLNESD